MDAETVRYWPRVGMYITQEFADEWIERLAATDGHTGKYLEDDIEGICSTIHTVAFYIKEGGKGIIF